VPRTPRLDEAAVRERLAQVPGWELRGPCLRRSFEFRDFGAAFAFMTRVAALAERADHHPDWSNSYARVVIELTSHDAGGLTQRDFDLARAIDGTVGGAIGG